MLVVQSKKQTIMQKLKKSKINLLIIITMNILLLQNLISLQQKFLVQDQHEITKTYFDNKLMSLNKKITQIKQNMFLLKMNLKKTLKKYLVFQLMYSYFKRIAGVGDDNYICF